MRTTARRMLGRPSSTIVSGATEIERPSPQIPSSTVRPMPPTSSRVLRMTFSLSVPAVGDHGQALECALGALAADARVGVDGDDEVAFAVAARVGERLVAGGL